MAKKSKNIEELKAKLWINDLAFLVDEIGHCSSLNKGVQGKN